MSTMRLNYGMKYHQKETGMFRVLILGLVMAMAFFQVQEYMNIPIVIKDVLTSTPVGIRSSDGTCTSSVGKLPTHYKVEWVDVENGGNPCSAHSS